MYVRLGQYGPYNPPAYYQSMETDPTQVPVQYLPYGAGGMMGPGLWPGFYFGQRPFTQEDAERYAKERQDFMEQRAATTENPTYKYISPEGNLPQVQQAMLSKAKSAEVEKNLNSMDQKKLATSIGLGLLISLILRGI